MSMYSDLVDAVIEENKKVLKQIVEKQIERFVDEVLKAKQIQIFGMGRMLAATRGFAMRLMHLGLNAHVVFDTNCPRIGKGDLLIVNCAATTIDLGIIKLAKEAGATTCTVTAHPENEQGRLVDFFVYLPGQIFGGPSEVKSIQPMASLFEQSLFLFEDIVAILIMRRLNLTSKQMEERHTNLEGVMAEFAG
jgi:6-phospho-3-hexuloisomerase